SFGRDAEADPPAVVGRRLANDQARSLEAPDVLGHARRRHPLERGELADTDPGASLDREQQRGLTTGDTERVNLPPQMAVELQKNRPERVRDSDGIGGCC